MAAIPTLSTLNTRRHWGGRGLSPGSDGDLAAELDALRTTVNAIISGTGHHTAFSVGGADVAGYATSAERAKFNCDGTNPPTVEAIRIQDQVTGAYYILTSESGVLTLTPA